MGRTDLQTVDIRLALTDSPVGDIPWMMKCREHDDGKASCAVYHDHIHCFGCGYHIKRRVDSLAYLLGFYKRSSTSFCSYGDESTYVFDTAKAFDVVHKYTSAAVDGYRERVALDARRDPLPKSLASVYEYMLRGYRGDRRQWLYDRGISIESINRFVLGHDGTRFTIPFFSKDIELLTLRFRRDDYYGLTGWDDKELAKYSGLTGRNASGAYLYPEWLVATQKEDHVVVVESELCVVRLRQEGIPAVCTFSGAGSLKFIPKLLEPFPHITHMYIAADQDEAGKAGAKELFEAATLFAVRNLEWEPSWGKDPTELYLNNHTLEEVGYGRD